MGTPLILRLPIRRKDNILGLDSTDDLVPHYIGRSLVTRINLNNMVFECVGDDMSEGSLTQAWWTVDKQDLALRTAVNVAVLRAGNGVVSVAIAVHAIP